LNSFVFFSCEIAFDVQDISQLLVDLQNSISDYRTRTQSSRDQIAALDAARLAAIFLSALITVILIILGIFFAFFKVRIGLMVYVVFISLFLICFWSSSTYLTHSKKSITLIFDDIFLQSDSALFSRFVCVVGLFGITHHGN
jgi:hypothetical protein